MPDTQGLLNKIYDEANRALRVNGGVGGLTQEQADALYVAKALYDANTVVTADTDNTPAALPMGASTILARLAAGNIKAATPAELKTLLAIAAADVSDFDTQVAATAVLKSLFDANTVLAADTDNTPAALTMGASTILARLAAGNIKAATPAEIKTLLAIAQADVTNLVSDLAAKAPLASPTFTGTPTVPDLAYNATTWNASLAIPTRNAVRDKIESMPRGELGYSEWTTDSTTTNTATSAASANKIAGVSVTVTGAGRAALIELFLHVYSSTANSACLPHILVGGEEAGGAYGVCSSPSTSVSRSVTVRRRMVLTSGQSYTFEVGKVVEAGTGHFLGVAEAPAYLAVFEE